MRGLKTVIMCHFVWNIIIIELKHYSWFRVLPVLFLVGIFSRSNRPRKKWKQQNMHDNNLFRNYFVSFGERSTITASNGRQLVRSTNIQIYAHQRPNEERWSGKLWLQTTMLFSNDIRSWPMCHIACRQIIR